MAQRDELSPTRARQGFKGRPVLYVLLGGLALGALFIIGLLAFGQGDKPTPTADPQAGRQTTEKPKSAQ